MGIETRNQVIGSSIQYGEQGCLKIIGKHQLSIWSLLGRVRVFFWGNLKAKGWLCWASEEFAWFRWKSQCPVVDQADAQISHHWVWHPGETRGKETLEIGHFVIIWIISPFSVLFVIIFIGNLLLLLATSYERWFSHPFLPCEGTTARCSLQCPADAHPDARRAGGGPGGLGRWWEKVPVTCPDQQGTSKLLSAIIISHLGLCVKIR